MNQDQNGRPAIVQSVMHEDRPLSQKQTEAGESLARNDEHSGKVYDVLRFPVIDWNFRWQRPQQLSVQFARQGHRVFYFSTVMRALEQEDASFEDISRAVTIQRLDEQIWRVQLCSRHPLNLYRDKIEDPADLRYLRWSIEYLRQLFQMNDTVSIIDLPFWAPLAFSLESNKVIYDCMDDHAGFSSNSSEMLLAEEQLTREADMVVTSSQRLFDYAARLNRSTTLIRNAVDYRHFSRAPERPAPEVAGLAGPVIGYYGAIADWFDIHLIAYLASRNRDWTFVLIGHTFGCDVSVVQHLDNVILTGEKPYHELPRYVHRFDVCLIPFLVNNLTLATNPVKMYEYLAAGKPVVSVKLPELETAGGLVYTAETPEQFEQAVVQALSENQRTHVAGRKQFAQANTWDTRYKELDKAIHRLFYPRVSIVIVSYNQWSYTKQCLESLFQNTDYPNLEVIVVDNNSNDETRSALSRMTHPLLKIIHSRDNKGFAGGNGLGCNASTGEYIVLLNNDTIVPPGWLPRLIQPLRDRPDLGMVAPMSNHVGNDQMLDHFVGDRIHGADPHWLADFYYFYKGRIRYTDLLGFFCVAMKREVYETVGELDCGYEIGMFEDDDYCVRARQAGYRLAIIEDAFVYHHGSISFKKMESERYAALWNKNKQYFEQKWGLTWVPPKPPATPFHEIFEPAAIAEKVRQSGKKSILLLGDGQWRVIKRRWQYMAEALIEDDSYLVITYADTYHDKPLVGTRKVGPSFYLTNRIDLFRETMFDLIVYCGYTNPAGLSWTSRFHAVDGTSYHGQDPGMTLRLPDSFVYCEDNMAKLMRQITALLSEPL
ncbi:glycosyltransferase [Paenibacillus doosanensis]|uniref:glycosyltransferase n=1 Tax=Paenibacillus doosanensis TaxID=1229154 RepID=UPI00218043DF|nr:glycosyltransferase [Paenibacillus doosanensis]MCS7458846.1 glycosyltransferase [Paenibacillus doosanensis]